MLINKLKPLKLHLIKLDTEVDQEFWTNGIFTSTQFFFVNKFVQ